MVSRMAAVPVEGATTHANESVARRGREGGEQGARAPALTVGSEGGARFASLFEGTRSSRAGRVASSGATALGSHLREQPCRETHNAEPRERLEQRSCARQGHLSGEETRSLRDASLLHRTSSMSYARNFDLCSKRGQIRSHLKHVVRRDRDRGKRRSSRLGVGSGLRRVAGAVVRGGDGRAARRGLVWWRQRRAALGERRRRRRARVGRGD